MLEIKEDGLVANLFSTQVYKFTKYSKVSVTPFDCSKEEEDVYNNEGNFTSSNNYILDLPHYKLIKDRIMEGLKFYAYEVLHIDHSYEFYITQSWLNITTPRGYHHQHSHANSIISGIYYVDCGEGVNESQTILINTNFINITGNQNWYFKKTKHTSQNTQEWVVPGSNNDIIYFPSTLQHHVGTNKAKTNRKSLSFNTFIKGKIGDQNYLSELKL
jgi:uncharacterized protein (TIGR02466 family)